MMLHEFTLVLAGIDEFTESEEDALYEVGFGDSLLTYADGAVQVDIKNFA